MIYPTRTTVIVEHDLTTLGQRTTKGTVARVTGKGRIPGFIDIETTDGKRWTVKPEDVRKAPRPWSWYQQVHPYADEEPSTGPLGRRWDDLDYSKGTDCKRTFSEDR
jgi:hypothetical protein